MTRPSRLTVYGAKLLTLAVANAALMTATFGVGAVASATIAVVESQPIVGYGQAAIVVAAYLLGFAALGGVLLRRRDVV